MKTPEEWSEAWEKRLDEEGDDLGKARQEFIAEIQTDAFAEGRIVGMAMALEAGKSAAKTFLPPLAKMALSLLAASGDKDEDKTS